MFGSSDIQFERSDIHLIVVTYSLLYLYNWLDIREQVLSDIDIAYSNVNGDEDVETLLVSDKQIPYEPNAIFSHTFGCLIKTILISFLMFLLINGIIVGLSTCSTLPFEKDYLKHDIKIELFKQVDGDEKTTKDEPIIEGGFFKKKVNTDEDVQERENEIKRKETEKENLRQLKIEEKEERKQAKLAEKAAKRAARLAKIYRVSKDLKTLVHIRDFESDDVHEEILTKARMYWLFFIKNFYISLTVLFVGLVTNLIFAKLVIPQVQDIDRDSNQMKTQMQILLFLNLVVYVGGIWLLALGL